VVSALADAGRDAPGTGTPRRATRVLIEPGSYRAQNMGDVAMLQAGLARLHRALPGCVPHVLTTDPARLLAYCPDVTPVPTGGREPWAHEGCASAALRGLAPRRVRGALDAAEWSAALRWPGAYARAALWRGGRAVPQRARTFLGVLRRMDLVVVAGQGSMGDASAGHAAKVLALLGLAQRHGIPTAMLGQGVGPLTDPLLVRRARAVLPAVALIALREGVGGPALLASLGVPAERVRVTGDDAVELAYALRPPALGAALGLNLRVSGNAGVGPEWVGALAGVLGEFARARGGPPLVPLPIAHGGADDSAVIRAVLDAIGTPADAAGAADACDAPDTPQRVIAAAGRCRVVVTGAYHAAVFALSQGTSAVCLSGSPYYDAKFVGLAALWGRGCRVVPQREGGAALAAALAAAWDEADAHRDALLAAARAQRDAGRAAAAHLADLLRVGGGHRG
jgi:hypothetical protein